MSLKILENKHGNLCPICKDPFIKKLNNLTDSLNKRFCLTMQIKTVCSHLESNDSQNDSQPDINTFHKISSGQMTGTMKSTEI